MISFDAPLVLYAAPVAALLMGLLAIWARSARVAHASRWSNELAAVARRAGRWGWVGIMASVLAATAALSGPRWGHRVVTAESKALNLVIAIDISRSMLAEDVAPSRLGRAQRQARRLIQDLASDRIGLVAFAGQSFIMSPLTVDGGALQLLVDGLDPDAVSSGGTALARVLKQGTELLLGEADVADRVLVLFTDGEGQDSLPEVLEQAAQLQRSGARLIIVAEGGREPAAIPLRSPGGRLLGEQRDGSGQAIRTWRRDAVLTAIADAAQGAVVSAELKDQAGAVRELVLAYKRAPQATALTSSGVPRAWIPLLAGVVLLLAHSVTRRTAALAVLFLALTVPGRAHAQGVPHPGDELWRNGDFRGAAARYIADVKRGVGGDTAWLAAGTAGLAINDTALAVAALSKAAESLDPEVRFRAVYNLGLLHLRQAAGDSAGRDRLLAEARRRYREALLLKPGDAAAKWNLELTIKRTPPESGGGANDPTPNARQGGDSREPPRPQSLTAAQAEQILNSISEDERRTRQEMNRRTAQSRQPTGDRDW